MAFIISILIMMYFGKSKTNFNDLALGDETSSYFAKKNNETIHFKDLESFESFKYSKKTELPRILILGNSQSHSINQMNTDDVNYIQLISDSLNNQAEILAISLPNISLQEMMLSFDYILSKIKIDFLVLPVFMDDLREDGIRTDVFFKNLNSENYFIKDSFSLISKKVNSELKTAYSAGSQNSDIAALKETPQEKVETFLNEKLDNYSAVWKDREQVRGDFFNALYIIRNTVLGIDAQTKRKMIPTRMESNFSALSYILDKCQKLNIKSIIYVPPIRTDVEPPYDLNEYENFKESLEKDVNKYSNAHFVNLENIVEGKYWGVKNATTMDGKPELDFMHFQYEGHKMLYKNLLVEMQKIMEE